MRTLIAALTLSFVLPSLAAAHVGVRPRESKPGAEERYTVRVPTEGAVATTSVRLEIPDGVTVLDVEATPGATFTTEKRGDRVVATSMRRSTTRKKPAATRPAARQDHSIPHANHLYYVAELPRL